MRKQTDRLILWVAALAAVVLVADSIISISTSTYLNLGSGVWLALARDVHDGVFYRPLWNGSEYGGTRYFPVLFVSTAALMRLGLHPVSAGMTVSMVGLLGMAVAVAVFLKRLGVSPTLVAAGATLTISPYFVHQTAFAIRCEPMAAGLGFFGLATITPLGESRSNSNSRILLAAGLFIAAFLTKITCVYAPAAAALALILAGRRAAAVKLTVATAAGAILALVIINLISGGRALESFRACALAGSSVRSLLSTTAVTHAIELIGTSHLLTIVFLLTVIGLIGRRKAWLSLPALCFVAAVGITAIIFTSPGTILTSQIVDAYVAAVVVLTTTVAERSGRTRDIGYLILALLGIWMAAQNVIRLATFVNQGAVQTAVNDRREIIAEVKRCGGAILSESPLIPVLAGQRPTVLDPFAFHVVSLNRPRMAWDLVERVRRQEFTCVILEQDPRTAKGQAWYSNVNFTKEVMLAILQHYRLDRTIGGQRFFRTVQ